MIWTVHVSSLDPRSCVLPSRGATPTWDRFAILHDTELEPEERLWLAVIYQALSDLRVGTSRGFRKTKARAREWFWDARFDLDFRWTCHLAGCEPEHIRALARRIVG